MALGIRGTVATRKPAPPRIENQGDGGDGGDPGPGPLPPPSPGVPPVTPPVLAPVGTLSGTLGGDGPHFPDQPDAPPAPLLPPAPPSPLPPGGELPGTFNSPADPASLTPFRTPSFGENRISGGLNTAAGLDFGPGTPLAGGGDNSQAMAEMLRRLLAGGGPPTGA